CSTSLADIAESSTVSLTCSNRCPRVRPQRCPIFGQGVPKAAIAPTTSSQNGTTPTPGIASRTSPGKSSHCQPSTTNNSAAVTTSTAQTIGGAKLANAPMTSDTPAMTKATASRDTENLRGLEAAISVERSSNSEGAEGSDIIELMVSVIPKSIALLAAHRWHD